jgi:hypothetical protein
MAEMYGTQSPYHFAGNNPINNMETNGAYYYMSPGILKTMVMMMMALAST